jgi:hypothetical protein
MIVDFKKEINIVTIKISTTSRERESVLILCCLLSSGTQTAWHPILYCCIVH